MSLSTLMWVVNTLAHVMIVVRGLQRHLICRYKAFYAFMIYLLILGITDSMIVVLTGRGSRLHYYAFYMTQLGLPFFQVVILNTAKASLPMPGRFRRSDYLLGAVLYVLLAAPVYLAIRQNPMTAMVAALAFISPFLTAFLVMVCRSILRVLENQRLGRNWRGIVVGCGLVILADMVNYERLYFTASGELYAFGKQFSLLLAYVIWTIDLWEYDPPEESSGSVAS